eukprot:3870089-Pyramimonas_sp.AAC.1
MGDCAAGQEEVEVEFGRRSLARGLGDGPVEEEAGRGRGERGRQGEEEREREREDRGTDRDRDRDRDIRADRQTDRQADRQAGGDPVAPLWSHSPPCRRAGRAVDPCSEEPGCPRQKQSMCSDILATSWVWDVETLIYCLVFSGSTRNSSDRVADVTRVALLAALPKEASEYYVK